MRTCRKCLLEKPDELFGVDKTRSDNRHPYCKSCRSKYESNQQKIGNRKPKTTKPTKEKMQEYVRKSRYRITKEEFEKMFSEQEGKCVICLKEMITPHIDHNHETGQVRGLLCKSCNSSLGLMKDSITLLENAIKYLKERDDLCKPCHLVITNKEKQAKKNAGKEL